MHWEYKPLIQECTGDQLHSFSPEPAETVEKLFKAVESEKSFFAIQVLFCLTSLLGQQRGITQMETNTICLNWGVHDEV